MSNTLNEQLAVIFCFFSHRVDWGFTFCAQFNHIVQVGYTNIQSKIKTNGLLSNPLTLMGGVHWFIGGVHNVVI